MATVTLAQVEARIPALFKSGKSYYFRSAPGRGKTSVVEAAPSALAKAFPGQTFGISIINAPLMTPPDTVGYLVPVTREGRNMSEFTVPYWFITSEGKLLDEYDGGIIFIDEVDKADMDVKKILGEMALSGRCGPHRIPKGWVVWQAGNRAQDRSGSTKELDHLINRRFELDIRDDLEGWMNWAFKNNVAPELVSFAKENPQIVFADGVPEKQGPWCTPRSLVATGEALAAFSDGEQLPVDEFSRQVAAGGIGDGAATQLFAHIRLAHELPRFEDIVAKPKDTRVPEKPDARMLVCFQLAARVNESNADAVITYMERLPKEFSVTFAKAATVRDEELVNTDAFGRWCVANASLMQAIRG
jgi:hypothetical protein